MFTPSLQPANKQICGKNRGLLPLAYTTIKPATQNPTHSAQHSLFSKADKKYHSGAIVAASSFDAELHIETTTIMFADVVESVRLIEQDEFENIRRIRHLLRHLADIVIPLHHGHVIECRGDGLLIRFDSPQSAAVCATSINCAVQHTSGDRNAANTIRLRIGMHSGELLTDNAARYECAISAVSRVACLANPDETVVSADVRDHLVDGLDVRIEDIGECLLEHVEHPLRVFRLAESNRDQSTNLAPLPRRGDTGLRPTLIVLPLDLVTSHEPMNRFNFADIFADQLVRWLSHSHFRGGRDFETC